MRDRTRKPPPPGVGRTIVEDLRRGEIRKTVRRDLRDIYEFYLDEEARQRLSGMSRVKRWFSLLLWLVKSLILNLSPVRRLLLLLCVVFVLIKTITFKADAANIGVDLTFLGFVILLIVLMLELKDKLLARNELETGRAVQIALLPREHPRMPGWDIWMFTRPANEVGGDLVDHLAVGDGQVGLVLGDVAGKGLGAALLMAKLQATVRALATEAYSMAELGRRLNAIFCRDQVGDRYATLVYLAVTPDSGALRILNAGHPPPVALRERGLEELPPVAPALGMLPGTKFTEQAAHLEPGDILLVYSDGVTEAQNPAGEFFGDERLHGLLAGLRPLSAAEAGDRLRQEVERFVGEGQLGDDLSLILLKRRP